MCRTARDAGVHLSKAGVSFLGKQGFCLVDVLPCLMDSTADAGHRHLGGGGGRVRREEVIRVEVRDDLTTIKKKPTNKQFPDLYRQKFSICLTSWDSIQIFFMLIIRLSFLAKQNGTFLYSEKVLLVKASYIKTLVKNWPSSSVYLAVNSYNICVMQINGTLHQMILCYFLYIFSAYDIRSAIY